MPPLQNGDMSQRQFFFDECKHVALQRKRRICSSPETEQQGHHSLRRSAQKHVCGFLKYEFYRTKQETGQATTIHLPQMPRFPDRNSEVPILVSSKSHAENNSVQLQGKKTCFLFWWSKLHEVQLPCSFVP